MELKMIMATLGMVCFLGLSLMGISVYDDWQQAQLLQHCQDTAFQNHYTAEQIVVICGKPRG
jgi:hypothetical protein